MVVGAFYQACLIEPEDLYCLWLFFLQLVQQVNQKLVAVFLPVVFVLLCPFAYHLQDGFGAASRPLVHQSIQRMHDLFLSTSLFLQHHAKLLRGQQKLYPSIHITHIALVPNPPYTIMLPFCSKVLLLSIIQDPYNGIDQDANHDQCHYRTKHYVNMNFGCHMMLMLSLAQRAIFRIQAILTAFQAACSRSQVKIMLNPDYSINCLASSMLVPFILRTMGFFMPKVDKPFISPRAMTSHLAIPANMLTNNASTLGSLSMIFSAAMTCSSVALPPTSRKLAGSPFLFLIRSMVAMANPAPLTMHPILPSKAMQLRSYLAASTSFQFFWVMSQLLKIMDCRYSELSSILSLKSHARILPSRVSPIGLSYNKVESVFVKHKKQLANNCFIWIFRSSSSPQQTAIFSTVSSGISTFMGSIAN